LDNIPDVLDMPEGSKIFYMLDSLEDSKKFKVLDDDQIALEIERNNRISNTLRNLSSTRKKKNRRSRSNSTNNSDRDRNIKSRSSSKISESGKSNSEVRDIDEPTHGDESLPTRDQNYPEYDSQFSKSSKGNKSSATSRQSDSEYSVSMPSYKSHYSDPHSDTDASSKAPSFKSHISRKSQDSNKSSRSRLQIEEILKEHRKKRREKKQKKGKRKVDKSATIRSRSFLSYADWRANVEKNRGVFVEEDNTPIPTISMIASVEKWKKRFKNKEDLTKDLTELNLNDEEYRETVFC
jgi:hypothetical protein